MFAHAVHLTDVLYEVIDAGLQDRCQWRYGWHPGRVDGGDVTAGAGDIDAPVQESPNWLSITETGLLALPGDEIDLASRIAQTFATPWSRRADPDFFGGFRCYP